MEKYEKLCSIYPANMRPFGAYQYQKYEPKLSYNKIDQFLKAKSLEDDDKAHYDSVKHVKRH